MCQKVINAPTGYIIRVYVNDFSIEDRNQTSGVCDKSYLKIASDSSERVYCGVRAKTGNNVFESTSNQLSIEYKTSSSNNGEYRGFNFYFESKKKKIEFI